MSKNIFFFAREKERDLNQSYDKIPYTKTRMQTMQHYEVAIKTFYYKTVAGQLSMVNFSNHIHPTLVVYQVYKGPLHVHSNN